MLEAVNLQTTIHYYQSKLGFHLCSQWPDDGEPESEWVMLQRDSIEIMYTSRNEHHKDRPTGLTGTLYCYTDDVKSLWNEWKDMVEIAWALEDFPYGMREFGIRDCNKYLLSFGQNIPLHQ